MLALLIALVSAQDAAVPPPTRALPPEARSDINRLDGTRYRPRLERCLPLVHHASPSRSGLAASSPEDGPVRLYFLLERRIDGCSAPLVAIDHLPEADRAIGRNLLRVRPPPAEGP